MSKRKRKNQIRSSTKPEAQTNNKTEDERREDKKKITLEDFRNIMTVVISFFALIVSLLGFWRNGVILEPRFSLEISKTDESDSENLNRIFKIYNVGGQIVNPKINPIIQIELICTSCSENGEENRQGTVLVGLLDYFPGEYSYKNAESAFIIQEKKANELYDLIEKIDEHLKSENDMISILSVKYYFEISYFDYRGKEKEKILYPTTNHVLIDYQDCKRERYFEKARLEQTERIKKEDILCPMSFEYKNGTITRNEGDEGEIYYIDAGEKADKYLSDFIQDYFEKYSIKLGNQELLAINTDGDVVNDNGTLIGFIEDNEESKINNISLLIVTIIILLFLLTICLKQKK